MHSISVMCEIFYTIIVAILVLSFFPFSDAKCEAERAGVAYLPRVIR